MTSIGVVNTLLLFGAVLVLAGILSSLVAKRFGAPLLLVFLGLGMLAGQDGPGGIAFNDYQLTYLVGSLALAVILFDGGLRTKLDRFRGTLLPAGILATLGVLLTAGLVAVLAHLLLGFGPLAAMLLGAIVASTDAAAVFFLLRSGGMRLSSRVGAVLEIESGTNDPVAVFLTVLLTELVLAGAAVPGWELAATLAEQAAFGGVFGLAGGFLTVVVVNRLDLPSGLHPLFVIAAAIAIFAVTSLAGGSGFLAVYLAGLVIGNRPIRAYPAIVAFHDAATWLMQIVMFFVLGLLVTPSRMVDFMGPALVIAVFLIVVARPAAVWLCLAPFRFSKRETAFIAWVGLRGAVSIFLASIPTLAGVPGAEVYFNVAFAVVLVSLIVQGWTLTTAARRLGLALPTTLPNVNRVELDLPGQLEQEMVGYPIAKGSAVLLYAPPPWARLIFVVRGGDILDVGDAGVLREGDYAYYLVPPDRVQRLDRLFAAEFRGAPALAGELSINGHAPLKALVELYGLEVDEAEAGMTVAELFAARYEEKPQLSDSVALGKAVMVVRSVSGDRVVRAGLHLPDLIGPPLARIDVLRHRARALAGRLRRRPADVTAAPEDLNPPPRTPG